VSQLDTRVEPAPTPVLIRIPEPRPPADDLVPAPPAAAPAKPRFSWRTAGLAIALYETLRLTCVAVAWFFANDQNRDLGKMLGRWDAAWYAGIATRGYDAAIPLKPDGTDATSNMAFFPLYPGLMALVDPILPGGADTAGIVVAWLFGAVAAAGIYAVGSHVRNRATGVLLAGLWAVIPHGFVESMGYTETLFTALASWSLYFVLRRQWIAAGLLCMLAGLSRPTSASIIVVVVLSALVAIVQRRDGWRPWVAGFVAPLGFLGYVAWIGHRLGRADGYVHVQNSAWKMHYDFGGYTVSNVRELLTQPGPLALYVITLVLLVVIALLVLLALDRYPWQLWLFAFVIFSMAFFGGEYYHSKARHIIPAFTLLLPVAAGLAKSRRHTAVVVLAVCTFVSAGYGVYLSLVWTGSP
jgi:Gpi18-like mannosyltransferase